MKTAEAWARRMKKVTDRTRAKICLSILPPPPSPPPSSFTFPRLPLPLPPPPSSPFPLSPLSFPTSSSSNSVLFFLLALFALLHLRSSPSPPSSSPPKLFTSRRGDGGEKPVGRFSNDASKERDHRTSDRFRSSSIVRGDEREKGNADLQRFRGTKIKKRKERTSLSLSLSRKRATVRSSDRGNGWTRDARSRFKTEACSELSPLPIASTRLFHGKLCPAASRNHGGAAT